MVLSCEMERVDMRSGEVINTVAPFVSKTEVVLEGTDVGELCNKASDKILESIAKFQMMGSNWRLKSVSRLEINTTAYKPLEGKSHIKHLESSFFMLMIVSLAANSGGSFMYDFPSSGL